MVTLTPRVFRAAEAAWAGFGPGWFDIRRLSQAWTAFPPSGTPDDSRDVEPSQRAIIWAAYLDRPSHTLGVVRDGPSWRDVVARIVAAETQLREAAWSSPPLLAAQPRERQP